MGIRNIMQHITLKAVLDEQHQLHKVMPERQLKPRQHSTRVKCSVLDLTSKGGAIFFIHSSKNYM